MVCEASPVINLFKTAAELQSFCKERGWRFCFIGGIAVQRWGQPRVTLDVDLTLLTGFGNEDRFIEEFLATYAPREENAAAFARRRRVLLLAAPDGTGIDRSALCRLKRMLSRVRRRSHTHPE